MRPFLLSLGKTCKAGPVTERLKMPVFSVSSGLIETMDPQHLGRRPCCWLLLGRVATKAWFSLSSTWKRNENLPGADELTLVAWRL